MEQPPPSGGGNVLPAPQFIVRRTASIGDCVVATIIADKLKEQGYECRLQCHPNIHAVLKYCPTLAGLDSPKGFAHVNLDGCYEDHPARRSAHFTQLFLAAANHGLASHFIELPSHNCAPRLVVDSETKQIALAKFADLPRPWIFICPRSNSYIVRQVPDAFWTELAPLVPGSKIWLGQYPAPPGTVDIQLQHLRNLVAWLTAADLLVTVDTGPMHIAAALGIPIVALGQSSSPELHLSDQRDFETVWPKEKLDCLNCQQNICPKSRYSPPCQYFDELSVANLVNAKVATGTVSALIPTFRADEQQLNKTISNVVDQVDEVVITVAADGIIFFKPNHPKVRVVRCPKSDIGFGKNVNFGMRHTYGRWVLLLNDDCYLNGNCVELLKEQCRPGVGMIAHLLRYPNGQIYFAGRQRRPGERGFPHINHRDYLPSISSVSEMEAVSCTSVLINRKAFYEIGGFDERFHMYAEDDDIGVRMRLAGYKLLYHPTALGVHEGSATVKKLGKQSEWIRASAALMERLWGPYWDWNKNRVPLGNFDYLKK